MANELINNEEKDLDQQLLEKYKTACYEELKHQIEEESGLLEFLPSQVDVFSKEEYEREETDLLKRIKTYKYLLNTALPQELPKEFYEYDNDIPDDPEIKTILDNINPIEKGLGIELEDLDDDILHNFLKNNTVYQLYYTLWRLEFAGNYNWIPINFLIFLQSYLSFTNKFHIKSTNEHQNENMKLNVFGWKISGGGKSAIVKHNVALLKYLNIPAETYTNMGTEANIRGTVSYQNREVDVFSGAMGNAYIGFEEIKTLLRTCTKQENAAAFMLDLMEKNYIDAGTSSSKKLIDEYKKTNHIGEYNFIEPIIPSKPLNSLLPSKITKPLTSITPSKPIKKTKPPTPLKTSIYRITTDKNKQIFDQSKVEFLNNANIVIMGQPILQNSSDVEKNAQRNFMFAQGFGFRGIHIWDNIKDTSIKKTRYSNEMTSFNNLRLKEVTEKFSDTVWSQQKLINHYQNLLKEALDQLPKNKNMIKTKPDCNNNLKNYSNWSPEWLEITTLVDDLVENNPGEEICDHLTSYQLRLQWKFIPCISYLLAYINGKEKPNTEIWKTSCKYCGKSLLNFKNYLEEVLEIPIRSKFTQIKDYGKPIMSHLKYMYNISKKRNEKEVDFVENYPNRKTFEKEIIPKITLTIGKFNKKVYNETLNELIKLGVIKITNIHPIKNKNFKNNTYKIILMDKSSGEPYGKVDINARGNIK